MRVIRNKPSPFLTLCLVASFLIYVTPCKCLAESSSTPSNKTESQELPPCHSSADHSSSDTGNESSRPDDCCGDLHCNNGVLFSKAENLDFALKSVGKQTKLPTLSLTAFPSWAAVYSQHAIRGSPPSPPPRVTSSSSLSCALCRWLIWSPRLFIFPQ